MSAYFGGKWLGKALIGFNADVENAKNQIAGMMAFAKKTVITDELGNANKLYDMLRDKASQLPGETSDYVNMLGLITNPLTKAHATLEEMRDVTAHSFVLAKAFGGTWQEAGRDIRDFLNNGQLYARDKFLRTVLNPLGYDADDKSRAKLRAMSIEERLKLLQEAINSPAAKSIADQLGSSFQGRFERVKDSLKLAMGKAGEAMFGSLKDSMTKLADWLDKNQGRIAAWAAKVGEYINKAFIAIRNGIMWLVEHKDVATSALIAIGGALFVLALRAAAAWAAILAPIAVVTGLVYMFQKLKDEVGTFVAALATLATAIGLAFAYKKIYDWINGIKAAQAAVTQLAAIQAAAGGRSAAGGFVNAMGPGFLGPAGASQHPQGAPGGPAMKGGVPGIGYAAALTGVGMFALASNAILDELQNPETTARANETLSQLWKTGSIGEAMKVAEQSVTVNQGPVTINVTAANPGEASLEVVNVLNKRDAEARNAYRNLTGNRGVE